MSSLKLKLENNCFYHIYNIGIEERIIFEAKKDILRFQNAIEYYQNSSNPFRFSFRNKKNNIENTSAKKLVEVLVFCVMPNHFHLILKQISDNGISLFMSKLTNSYVRYFNQKSKRLGPLFKSSFKFSKLENIDELIKVSRYIHLDPLKSNIVTNLDTFPFSSYSQYVNNSAGFCNTNIILNTYNNSQEYKNFIQDQEDYQKSLEDLKSQIFE